jgi:hypothetical protein
VSGERIRVGAYAITGFLSRGTGGIIEFIAADRERLAILAKRILLHAVVILE